MTVAALWSYTRLTLVSAGPEAVEWAGSGVAVGGDMRWGSRAVLSLGSAVSPASTAELDVELGSDCGAGRARRAGVGDSGEDDAEEAGWAVAWAWDWGWDYPSPRMAVRTRRAVRRGNPNRRRRPDRRSPSLALPMWAVAAPSRMTPLPQYPHLPWLIGWGMLAVPGRLDVRAGYHCSRLARLGR